MVNNKTIYGLILILSLLSNFWFGYMLIRPASASESGESAQSTVEETVKLYSEGKVVEKWEATGQGQWSDGTYLFRVGEGAYHKEVRIHGTFSVVRTN